MTEKHFRAADDIHATLPDETIHAAIPGNEKGAVAGDPVATIRDSIEGKVNQ